MTYMTIWNAFKLAIKDMRNSIIRILFIDVWLLIFLILGSQHFFDMLNAPDTYTFFMGAVFISFTILYIAAFVITNIHFFTKTKETQNEKD